MVQHTRSVVGALCALLLCSTAAAAAFLVPTTTPTGRTTCTRPSTELGFFNFGKNQEKASTPQITKDEKQQQQQQQQQQTEEAYYEKDPVEKVFEFFFGKPEAEPLGLKRFGKERFPEQYPATIDEWAIPVAGDTAEMARFRPLLQNTNLETRRLRLTYDANRDGWDATAFHRAVDKQGGALVTCTTLLGVTTGGYNPKGWVGYGENRGSVAAFLFKQNANGSFTKLRKVGGGGMAQMDNPESGP